jgi:glycosyltransferase involved in cell wall biosynthesis
VHEKKGQDILIKAISTLVSKYPAQDVSLDFIGDGPSSDYLQALARELKIESRLRFAGNKDRHWIKKNLSRYHILVQPSRFEGFGLTIVEGIAAGLPTIASDIDGPREILGPYDSCYLFAKDNEEDLAKRLSNIINTYRNGLMEGVFSIVYDTIGHRYSIDSTVTGYLKVYSRIAKKDFNKIPEN